VVNRLSRDRQRSNRGQHCEKRHEQKDGALRKGPTNNTRDSRDGYVAGVVERGVAAHSPSQLALPV
jgi:hypothetical protein